MTIWHEPQYVRRMFQVSSNDTKKQLSGDLLMYLGDLKLNIEPKQVTKLKRLSKEIMLHLCSEMRYYKFTIGDIIQLFNDYKITVTEK